jgi:ribose transport system ATP-binding protein
MRVNMNAISKQFGPVRVLDAVSLELTGGEIHALVGENGAGKSTLMKILSGAYIPDAGSITIDGVPAIMKSSTDAEALGIAIIHQELNLMPQLTIMENLFLGREPNRFGIIKGTFMRSEARRWLSAVGADHIDPDREAGTMSVGQQQLVEIAKALALHARVLIMDEPTASLTDREIEVLFRIMRELKARGVAIVYVSHRMEEIFTICDKISVLRDGHFVGERLVAQTQLDEIVKMMVGRDLHERFPTRTVELGPVVLSVDDLADEGHVEHIHFAVRAGEVLGIAGLLGAGRSEILNTLFGVNRRTAGQVQLEGVPVTLHSPSEAVAAGIGFVTEDRKSLGLVMLWSVRENVSLVHLESCAKAGIIDEGAERALVKRLMAEVAIRARDSEQAVGSLSGGNQQKVVFAKWLVKPPRVLLLDEPTRGVDVGGKSEIYGIINRLAAAGTAIVMVSSELPEVMAMSDRILVMHEGRQAAVLETKKTTQEAVISFATTGTYG